MITPMQGYGGIPAPPDNPGMADMRASSGYGPTMPTYDPMAAHFLTGGRMGYMPDAQYLTSSQYGAFRTTPQQGIQTPLMHQPSLWQSYLTANRGAPPMLPIDYLVNTYNPSVSQLRHLTMSRRRIDDAGAMFGSTAFDLMAPFAVGAGVSAVAGPLAGLAAGIATPAVGSAIADRTRQARALQNLSMTRIVGGADMSEALGRGFSQRAAATIDESIRGEAAQDLLFKESDYRRIMKLGVEAGMFDFSSNAEQYKRMVKKLRDNFKVFGELLEVADLGELGAQMQRMMRMGANVEQMQGIGHFESMFSRMAGMSHQDMVNTYGQQGALLFSQMGLTNYQGSTLNMANAARIEMQKRFGLLNPAEIARRGGISGMAQDQTSTMGEVERNTMFSYLPYVASDDFTEVNGPRLTELLSGNVDTFTAMRAGAGNIRRAEDMSAYMGNRAELHRKVLDQLGPEGLRLLQYRRASDLRDSMGLQGTQGLAASYQMMGWDAEGATQEARAMSNPELLRAMQDQLRYSKHNLLFEAREDARQERGLTRSLKRGYREWRYNTFEEPLGSLMQTFSAGRDYEENAAAGIYTTGVYGVSAGLIGYSEDELGAMAEVGGLPALSEGEIHTVDRRSSDYRLRQSALNSRNQSTEERSEARKELDRLGISEVDAASMMRGMDAGDFTRSGVKNRLIKKFRDQGLSLREAQNKTHRVMASGQAMAGLYSTAFEMNDGLEKDLAFEMSEETGDILSMNFDQLKEYEKEVYGGIGELVEQSWIGTDNAEDRAALVGLATKSIKALYGATAETLLQEWIQARGKDPEKEAQIKALLRDALIRDLGLDPDKVDELIQSESISGLRNLIKGQLSGKYGMAEEDILKAFSIGGRRAEDSLSMPELQTQLQTTRDSEKGLVNYSLGARRLDMTKTLEGALRKAGLGISADKVIRDPEAIRSLLARNDLGGKSKNILQAALKQHQSGEGFSTQRLLTSLGGTLSDQVTATDTDSIAARSIGEKKALESLDIGIESLTQVLSELAGVQKKTLTFLQERNSS